MVIILISIPAVLYPKAAEEVVSAIYQPFAANFGTLYLWITVGLIILCVYFACSRYGDIKFGDPDEKPEFSLSSWIAMIFCSGVAGAVMFWSIIEPLWDIVQPPQYAAPMSTQAYDWALAYLLLHWGPNAWCTYFITALPIAYMFHIRRKPFLRISSAADMIIGKQKDGLLGRCVDVFFILGLLLCFRYQCVHFLLRISPGNLCRTLRLTARFRCCCQIICVILELSVDPGIQDSCHICYQHQY